MNRRKEICDTLRKGLKREKKMIGDSLRGPVGGFILTTAGLVILAMNGVDVSGLLTKEREVIYTNGELSVSRAAPAVDRDALAEEGIRNILEGTNNYDFDSNLLCAAREIRDIAVQTGSGNKAKTAALNALSVISSRCDFDSSRKEIAGYIKEIATAI